MLILGTMDIIALRYYLNHMPRAQVISFIETDIILRSRCDQVPNYLFNGLIVDNVVKSYLFLLVIGPLIASKLVSVFTLVFMQS